MKLISIQVGDIRDCPFTDASMLDCIAFWDRWRGRPLLVGKPFAADALKWVIDRRTVPCDTDLYWPVIGPAEFILEFRAARFGDFRSHENSTPTLCRHLIAGD